MKPQVIEPVIRGREYRERHAASVIGILGKDAPPVLSQGARFLNMDRWTIRRLTSRLCEWAAKNSGCVPTVLDLSVMCRETNAEHAPGRQIVIASTPDKLTLRVALALTGGGYHEALHTLYSCRRSLRTQEMAALVLPRWAKVKDWSRVHMALQDWSNIVEDIRIERRGSEQFEGIYIKLCDLQDFILGQEAAGEANVRAHGGQRGALSIIEGTFRDVGLGYNTEKQRDALDHYRKEKPDAVDLVLNGPLRPMLDEAIQLTVQDDLGCLRIAMDVIAKLAELGKQDEEDSQTQNGPLQCPSCGASADKLKVRPKSNGVGGKVPGVEIMTCTVCGWQQEVKITPKPKNQPQPQQPPQPQPQMEGFDESDSEDADGDDASDQTSQGKPGKQDGDKPSGKDKAGKDKPGKDGKNKKQAGKTSKDKADPDEAEDAASKQGGKNGDSEDDPEESEDAAESSSDGEGEFDGDPDENSSDGESDGDASDGEGADSDSDDGEASDGVGDGSSEGTGQDQTSGDEETNGKPANGAGGHHHHVGPHAGNTDWENLATTALQQATQGTGLLDNNKALEEAVNTALDKEESDVQRGEAPWSPLDPGLDTAAFVSPSARGKAYDLGVANQIKDSVTKESAYLRARLRAIIRALEMVGRTRGVRKGRTLSSRYLVQTHGEVQDGQYPTRAWDKKGEELECRMAVATVVDESGSMGDKKREAGRMLVALTEPFDALTFPTMAIGFRDGAGNSSPLPGDTRDYHRTHGVHYDVFKAFHERFGAVKWRFANTMASGGTPMSDGIEFALRALGERPEPHRFLFVVTDGEPNGRHVPVIRRQVRRAQAAGIHIIGVGVGDGSRAVVSLFPDHVWSLTVSETPALILAKLNDLVDVLAHGRGKKPKA